MKMVSTRRERLFYAAYMYYLIIHIAIIITVIVLNATNESDSGGCNFLLEKETNTPCYYLRKSLFLISACLMLLNNIAMTAFCIIKVFKLAYSNLVMFDVFFFLYSVAVFIHIFASIASMVRFITEHKCPYNILTLCMVVLFWCQFFITAIFQLVCMKKRKQPNADVMNNSRQNNSQHNINNSQNNVNNSQQNINNHAV